MKQVQGIWLPDNDEHFEEQFKTGPSFWGLPTYQFRKFAAAFPYIKDFRHAVDIGAHCGLWSRVLERIFPIVTAFEPVPENAGCLRKNTDNTDLEEIALGKESGSVRMNFGGSNSGNASIQVSGTIEVPVKTLDSYGFERVDFIKIDCEGYEHNVVMGGLETIKRCRPVIIVEQHNGHLSQTKLPGAVNALERLGMKDIAKMNSDHLMVF